ncbi:MAG: leucine-rich repeat domain-containing protein [Phycisphaerae bacterium]|nr:leucine-rich repeat domain-containing protein [Phycisphaerae bacterium]
MKNVLFLILIYFNFGMAVEILADTANDPNIVVFADENLKAAIETELGVTDPNVSQMQQLTKLYADGLNIVDISGIGYATNLKELYLYNNQISELPAEISNLVNLEKLYLNNNLLGTICPEVGQLVKLEYLWLHYNNLNCLPVNFGDLIELREISLHHNIITRIPEEIGNLIHLEVLSLGQNQLSSLPDGITNLTELKTLNASNNLIRSLPEQIGNLNQLRQINLVANKLTNLPETITNLHSLEQFWLIGNQLDSKFYCILVPQLKASNPELNFFYDPDSNPLAADCTCDLLDLGIISLNWTRADCQKSNEYCDGADLNHDGFVNLYDLAIMNKLWLEK